jgi:hypothetical protein
MSANIVLHVVDRTSGKEYIGYTWGDEIRTSLSSLETGESISIPGNILIRRLEIRTELYVQLCRMPDPSDGHGQKTIQCAMKETLIRGAKHLLDAPEVISSTPETLSLRSGQHNVEISSVIQKWIRTFTLLQDFIV